MEAKVFIRELWASKCDWDDQLGDKQQQEWLRISKNLEKVFLNIKSQDALVFMRQRTVEMWSIV